MINRKRKERKERLFAEEYFSISSKSKVHGPVVSFVKNIIEKLCYEVKGTQREDDCISECLGTTKLRKCLLYTMTLL